MKSLGLVTLAGLAFGAFAEPTGCPDFSVEAPRGTGGPVVQATAFGLSSATSNNAAAVNAALAEAKRRGAHRVVLAPGTYYCHDAKGIVAEGLEDVELDGKGATLVFYRPSDFRNQPQWVNDFDGSSFWIKGCTRFKVSNLNLDWDWEKDPLGAFVTVSDVHVGDRGTFESYLDLKFVDYNRHPLYGKPFPIQTLYSADESRERMRLGENHYFGQSEGHFGCKMKWLAPNRIRIWPGVKSDCGPYSSPQYDSRLTAEYNYWTSKRHAVGDFLRLGHYYYGKNCFVVENGGHVTFSKVNILSCRGMGWVFDGTVHHVHVVDCNVLPPHRLRKQAKGPAKRPFTTTCDVVHVSHGSQGYFKFENYRAAMNQDDLYNFHDRSTWVARTGPRELTVTQKRGLAYFGPAVGDVLELLGKDYAATGFAARIVAIDGERMTVDRDVPDRFRENSIAFDRNRDTGHVILRNCVHEGATGRCCISAPNVTIDGLVMRDTQGQAMKFQSGTTTDKWSEGYGCTNVVVRNCTIEDVNLRCSKMYGVTSDIFIGVNYENGKATDVKPVDTLVSGILFENNTFIRPRGQLFHIRGASGVIERDNRVISADYVPEVKFERQDLGPVAPVPQVVPFTWEAKDGLLYRDGKPDYWIGNGSDLGASQATPLGLWLAWLQGSKMISVTHSTTRFDVRETNGTLVARGDLRPSAVPWLREAIRLGFLTQAPDGCFNPAGSAWLPHLARYPQLLESIYDSGHHMGADPATPIGRATLVEKRAPLFAYGDGTGYFLPELNREPGPDPYNDRVKRGFRDWCRRKYGTLEEANRTWKTKFAQWDDVTLRHTVEGAPSPDVYKCTAAEAETRVKRMRNLRGSIRRQESNETPELYMDWICYVQEDSHAFTRTEFEDVRRLAPRSLPGMDLRAHQSQRDNYVEYDPSFVDTLEDIFYIHFVFKATDYGKRPMNEKALADLICWPLFECKYFRSVSKHPIVNCEDIITQTAAAAPSRDAMAKNDLADFAHAKWTLKPNGAGGVAFTCTFTVPKRYEADFADGSRRFSLCGYKNAPGVWFNLNGQSVPSPTFSSNFYQIDVSRQLRFGGENVLRGSLQNEPDLTKRPDCFILAQDMLGAFTPFGEKQYTAMFWSYLMNAHSSAIVWNWNAHEKLRLWEAALARKLSAAAEIALPDLRHRRNDVAFLYAYTGGLGLPSPREGRHYRLMNWAAALEFSGHRFDAIGEDEFQASVAPTRDASDTGCLAPARDAYPGRLAPADYKVVVAPDQALVKEATLAAAKRYVEKGGRLIITPASFEKTFARYAKTDFAAFAKAHADRVTVIDGEPTVAELMAKFNPLLPEPDLAVSFAASEELPCVERVLAGDAKRKVLYLQNWGGLDHEATVTLPQECRGWTVTPLHGDFSGTGGRLVTKVPGSLGVSAAILSAPGAKVPNFAISPVRARILAKVEELNKPSPHPSCLLPPPSSLIPPPSPRRVLFPKDMLGYYKQGELSSDTICGKEIYPYLLDRAKAFGYEVDELEPVKWTAEVLAKYDLVMMLCGMDNQQWTPIAKDRAHHARFQKAIDAYVKNGGSLFCQIYSGQTACANMSMCWMLTPALWRFKGSGYVDPQDPAHCGFGDPRQILTGNIASHEITAGVKSVQLGFVSPILRLPGCALEPLVSLTETASACPGAAAMAAQEYGKGRIFVNLEPMAFQPFRIEHADNAALLENVFGWLSRTPVTQAMRDEFKANLFLTEADMRQIAKDEKGPVRVLAIGNSYTQSLLPEFPQVAKAAGVDLDLAIFAIGGKSLSNHWVNCETALKDPSFRPYDVNGEKTNLPKILSEGRWDVVTFQEQSADGMRPEAFVPWADRLIAFVRARQPQARIFFQQTWSDTVASFRMTEGERTGTLDMTPDQMYEALERNYAAQAKRFGAGLIPVGGAVQLYRRELPVTLHKPSKEYLAALKPGELPDLRGELSGWWEWSEGKPWEKDRGVYRLRQDFHHLNREGKYLQACVWAAALFDVDVTDLPYAPEFGEDFLRRAPLIRRCAMESVRAVRTKAP